MCRYKVGFLEIRDEYDASDIAKRALHTHTFNVWWFMVLSYEIAIEIMPIAATMRCMVNFKINAMMNYIANGHCFPRQFARENVRHVKSFGSLKFMPSRAQMRVLRYVRY